MKKLLMTAIALAVVATFAGNAAAVIGWAGNAYPNNGANIAPTGDQFVVAQVWKGGVTDAPGQGPDIAAELRYQTDLMGAYAGVAMAYNTDIGNNDEYIGFIPQAALIGASYVDVTVVFTDLTDMTTFEITGDQLGNPPPLRYNVLPVLPVDVDVTFTLCMSGEVTTGDPCVIGSAAEIGSWGTGVNMTSLGGDLYEVTVTFLAGGNPAFEYKYKKDACSNWEGVGNRLVTLPTDGNDTVVLAWDSWNNLPMGCGVGETLDADRTLCIQVCMENVDTTGGVCVTGGVDQLTNWGSGAPMTHLGGGLYQACIVFPQGTAIPLNVEFKFRKDGCETWESVANRVYTVDNGMPLEDTVTYSWDDGPGTCAPIPVDSQSWGAVKSRF